MTTPYFIIVFLLCILTAYINYGEIKKENLLNSRKEKFYLWATQAILFAGIFLRLIYLEYPSGINLDEAIAGYDAWCLANYGVDQHLYSYPVYLKSWGSGQSALYAYLSAPLIKLFGLSLPMHRLPMAIISSASLFCLYFALKKSKAKYLFIFLCILFFIFNPWHFTKSRWALDCNLAPDLLLIATSLIIIAFYSSKKHIKIIFYILGFCFIGLTAYGYAVAWIMLPFYCLAILFFLYKKGNLNFKKCLILLVIALTIVSPLILFAFQLVRGGNDLSIGAISIPRLNEGRHATTVLSDNNIQGITSYIGETVKSLITGYDYLLTNSFPYTGQFYNPIGWIFILLGIVVIFRKKETYTLDTFFLIWLLTCIPIVLFISYNVNRWNMIWIPLIYFCIRGVYFCISGRKIFQILFYIIFTILTIITAINYKIIHYKGFIPDVKEIIDITSDKRIETVYFTERVQYPAILFFDPISPIEFNQTKEEINPGSDFIYLNKFGKYNLGSFPQIEPTPHTAYVILSRHLNTLGIDHSAYKIYEGEWLTVLWNE